MSDGYELLDCGDRRRLERFGSRVLDRPAPGATEPRRDPGTWVDAITYRAGRGWAAADGLPAAADDQPVEIAGIRLLTSLAAGGQVGVFPEHGRNAAWVRAAVARRLGTTPGRAAGDPPAVLNLFAYTGLLTLIAASEGAAVTHVDASRPAVQWARRNADANGMADRPIRWIIDDALAFLRREARRGRTYEGLILDPPSYGHGGHAGAGGNAGAFRFDHDIGELLAAARAVASPDAFWLLSTHTIGWDPRRIAAVLAAATGQQIRTVGTVPLELTAASRARLALGAAARFDPLDAEPR